VLLKQPVVHPLNVLVNHFFIASVLVRGVEGIELHAGISPLCLQVLSERDVRGFDVNSAFKAFITLSRRNSISVLLFIVGVYFVVVRSVYFLVTLQQVHVVLHEAIISAASILLGTAEKPIGRAAHFALASSILRRLSFDRLRRF